jgi:hypothetical protein
VKKVIGILMGIALNIQITFGSTVIFMILFLPIHEHGKEILATFLCPLLFLSSVIYNSCGGLSLPLLNLFLDILFFEDIISGIFP